MAVTETNNELEEKTTKMQLDLSPKAYENIDKQHKEYAKRTGEFIAKHKLAVKLLETASLEIV